MNDGSLLQTFLDRFKELKAATGDNPKRLRVFDQASDEIRAAARRMHPYLMGSDVQQKIFHGADKIIPHAPENTESLWNEFKLHWEPGINYLSMCEDSDDDEWPRDYNEHIKLYKASGVVPDEADDLFLPGFHVGRAAIQQALDYLRDHDHEECRAGLMALRSLDQTIGLDLVAVMERWGKVPIVFMPSHVADQQQKSQLGPLGDLFENAVRAYVCGAPAAAFAMCRALLETVLKQSYLPEELKGRERDIKMGKLLSLTGPRHSSIPRVRIGQLVAIANEILHGGNGLAAARETDLIEFFKILKNLIQKAPAPR
jgi:hypothetical protein